MHRFYLPPPWDAPIRFSPPQQHQLARVLRLRRGDIVQIYDGAGGQAEVELQDVSQHAGGLIVPGSQQTVAWPSAVRPLLYLSLIRPQRFEWAIEKATELGVWRIVPLLTARLAHGGRDVGAEKRQRWRNIAVEAAEQCGSAYVPEIAPPCPLPQALDEAAAVRLLAWEGDGVRETIRQALAALSGGVHPPSPTVALFIGPEGGFEPGEVEVARAAGCRLVTLGPRTLRAETAALAALALLGDATASPG